MKAYILSSGIRADTFYLVNTKKVISIVLDGPFIPMIEEKDGERTRLVPKPRQKYDEAHRKKIEKVTRQKLFLSVG